MLAQFASAGRNAAQAQLPAVTIVCQRSINQLVHRGRGGRSSVDGATVTVFGATGTMGRYLVNELGKRGTQIIIPYRGDEMHWRHLRPMGDVGQITFMEYDIRDMNKVREAVKYSDVVFNLAGRDYPTRNFSFTDIHVQGARNVARACTDAGVERLIHVSALGAAKDSPSTFLKAKAAGEKAVREEFASATIVRPAQLFGAEDHLFHKIAFRMQLPGGVYFADPEAVRYPVYAPDVGRGLAACVRDDRAPGNTYEFIGPEHYSLRDLTEYTRKIIRAPPTRVYKMPNAFLHAFAYFQGLNPLYAPLLTADEVTREALSEKPEGLPGIPDLGVELTPAGKVAITFLRQYRKHIYHDEHIEDKDTHATAA